MMKMPMAMYFYYSTEVWWLGEKIKTDEHDGYFALGLVVTFLICLLCELVAHLKKSYLTRDSSSNLLQRDAYQDPSGTFFRKTFAENLLERAIVSGLYLIHTGLHFLIMLLVMTFNLWVFLVVIFGSGVGYFLFRSYDECSEKTSKGHC